MEDSSNSKPIDVKTDGSPKRTGKFWRSMIVAGVVIMFYMSGIISYTPLLSQFIRKRVSETYFNSSNATTGSECTRNTSDENVQIGIRIQQESANMVLYLSIPSFVIAAIVNLFIGSYSDFLGRRFLFFVPTLGSALRSLVLCFVTAFNLPLKWLYLGAVFEGLSGGGIAFLLAVFSYTADVTDPSRSRTLTIAIMEGIFAVSGSLGSIAVGYIIQRAGFMFAAIASTIMFTVGIVILLAVLPETVTHKAERRWSPIVHLKNVLGFFFSGTRKRRALYILTMSVFFLAFFVAAGRTSVETLYQLDRPFCWTSVKIGYYGALRNTFGILCSVIGLKLLQPYFRDMTIGLIGLGFGMASFLTEGLAVNDGMMYAVPVISLISFNIVPVSRAIMSQMTSPLQQGAMFSSLAAMESVCGFTSTAVYNAVYQRTVGTYRGAVFILMAGIGVVTATVTIIFLHLTKHGIPKHELLVPAPSQSPIQNEKTEQQPPSENNVHLQNVT